MPNPFEDTSSLFPGITQAVSGAYNENIANGTATDVLPDETDLKVATVEEADKQIARDFAERVLNENFSADGTEANAETDKSKATSLECIEAGDENEIIKWVAVGIGSGNFHDDDLKNAWRIIEKNDGKISAMFLAWGIEGEKITGEYLERAMKIIEKNPDSGAAGGLAWSIGKKALVGNNIKRAMTIINEYGDETSATSLAYCLGNPDFAAEYQDQALKLILERGDERTAQAICSYLEDHSFGSEDLSKVMQFIENNCNEEVADTLAIYINEADTNIDSANMAKALEIIEKYGGEGAATSLTDKIINERLTGNNAEAARTIIERIRAKQGQAQPPI